LEKILQQAVDIVDETEDIPPWDERIGPVGVVSITLGACAIAWTLMMLLL